MFPFPLAESISAGVVLVIVGTGVKFLNSRMKTMESDRKKDLFQNGQSIYVPRTDCLPIQETFCKKIDEVKSLIISMDEKRELAKDIYHNEQKNIAVQLAAIEAKLPE